MRALAITATVPAAATLYFFVFWSGFSFWRRHRIATYVLFLGTIGGFAAAAVTWRRPLFADATALPAWLAVIGWIVIAIVILFSLVADRQLGLHVRSFAPFFDDNETIELRTGGAYGVVRHPLYAGGSGYQIGVFLITGSVTVAIAWAVFTLGALWFTRQEERRLIERLRDPDAYRRYRARVPALLPWPRPRGPR